MLPPLRKSNAGRRPRDTQTPDAIVVVVVVVDKKGKGARMGLAGWLVKMW